uniref:DUF4166 domain-containing protein n=1 Tax=Panagrellus redivivus TaxID=6233 RepID=A0A7E4VXS4_PANRE
MKKTQNTALILILSLLQPPTMLSRLEKTRAFQELHAVFAEEPRHLRDMPTFWQEKLKDVRITPKVNNGVAEGIVVAKYRYVALVYLFGSIGDHCLAYRQLLKRSFPDLKVGTLVSIAQCPIVYPVPRLYTRAVQGVRGFDFIGFTQLDDQGRYTCYIEAELYDVRLGEPVSTIQTEKYGRVRVPPSTPMKTWLETGKWTLETKIVAEIRYDVQMFDGFTTFFEFIGTVEVLPPKKAKK